MATNTHPNATFMALILLPAYLPENFGLKGRFYFLATKSPQIKKKTDGILQGLCSASYWF